MVDGALGAPLIGPPNLSLGVRMASHQPVYLVSGGAVLGAQIGTASYASIYDPTPGPGFGNNSEMLVVDFGGLLAYAGAIDTAAGRTATLSAGAPYQQLSGSWSLTDGTGSGISGAGPEDAIVTLTADLNSGSPSASGFTELVLDQIFSLTTEETYGVGGLPLVVNFARGAALQLVQSNAVGAGVGTATSYLVCLNPTVCLRLVGLDFGGFQVLSVCRSGEGISISCALGSDGPWAALSGRCSLLGGVYSTIAGVSEDDQVWSASWSLASSATATAR